MEQIENDKAKKWDSSSKKLVNLQPWSPAGWQARYRDTCR
jgi:hypothetical protein